jgi:hypothetical protein
MYERAASTAARWASITWPETGWPPSAQVRETDFGAEKVRSNPGTGSRPGADFSPSGSPVTGLRPVSIAVSWSGSTFPSRSNCAAAWPIHSPSASPRPE